MFWTTRGLNPTVGIAFLNRMTQRRFAIDQLGTIHGQKLEVVFLLSDCKIGYQPHSTTSTFLHSQLLGHGRTWCVFLCSLAQVNSLTTWWASKDVKPGMVVDIWWQSNEISVEGWKPLSGWCADIIRYYTYDLYRFVCLSLKWEPVPVIICILTLDISVSTFIPHHLSIQPSPCALGRMARLGPQSSNGNHLVVVLVVDMSCNFMYKLDSL